MEAYNACGTAPCGPSNFQRNDHTGFRKSLRQMFALDSMMGNGACQTMPGCQPCAEPPKKRTGYKEEEYTVQVPFTKKIKVPVQVPTYQKKTVCREVTEQRTKWVKTKVPAKRIVKETIRVPAMKTVYRTQTQKCFRTETKLRKVPFEYEVTQTCQPMGMPCQPCQPMSCEMPCGEMPCGTNYGKGSDFSWREFFMGN